MFVISYRPLGHEPVFFRGDNRYELYLPALDIEDLKNGHLSKGWVWRIRFARVFESYPCFDNRKTHSPLIDIGRIKVSRISERDRHENQFVHPLIRPRR